MASYIACGKDSIELTQHMPPPPPHTHTHLAMLSGLLKEQRLIVASLSKSRENVKGYGSSWGDLSQKGKCHYPQDDKQQISSISFLHVVPSLFLGHLLRIRNEHLPKQLLVSAPVGGKQAAGGQKCQWVIVYKLKQCNL